eukprot:GDKI01045791.1.p1 GENE.GDKI01045791.1~~GDKI01045791.1.p1  ORF type:complete len:154 (+),score=12.72 GDKI01045791.1:70-531(+)
MHVDDPSRVPLSRETYNPVPGPGPIINEDEPAHIITDEFEDDPNAPLLSRSQIIVLAMAVTATCLAALDGATTHFLPSLVAFLIQYVEQAGSAGYLLFSALTMVCSLCFVPLMLVDIAGTFAFVNALGFWRGWCISTLCIIVGALAAALRWST